MDKTKMFTRYAKNLKNIRSKLGFDIRGCGKDSNFYICPLSLKIYSEEGLSPEYDDQLTIEHVPPKSLGGKGVLLTNKISNSQAGHTLDSNLFKYIIQEEFNLGKGGVPVKYKFDNKYSINGELENSGELKLSFKPKEMHQGAQNVLNLLQAKQIIPIQFSFKKPKDPSIALLRVAYLLAFSTLGYSFIFGLTKLKNPNIDKIRKQLNSPEESILDKMPILKWDLADEFLGVNIIYEPKEIKSLLVVFDLFTQNLKHRFCVILPGPDDFGFSAINNLKQLLMKNKNVDFKAYTFPEKLMLENPDDSLQYWTKWIELNGETRL